MPLRQQRHFGVNEHRMDPKGPKTGHVSLATHWNVTENKLAQASALLQQEIPTVDATMQLPLLFVYAKDVFKPHERKFYCEILLSPPDPDYQKARERLCRLVLGDNVNTRAVEVVGDTTADTAAALGIDSLDDALKKLPSDWWKADYFFFRDNNLGLQALVQRLQKSRWCYLHAPVVLQHYLVAAHNTKNATTGMLDIRKTVMHKFSARQLKEHIMDDAGGNSVAFLESILEPGSIVFAASSMFVNANLMRQYGPALVAVFKVHDDFSDNSKHVFTGGPQGNIINMHAMVMVGVIDAKKDTNTPARYLLQNWWESKQFVEVDADYLKRVGANVHFVETPQRVITGELQHHSFAETEGIEMHENYLNEN